MIRKVWIHRMNYICLPHDNMTSQMYKDAQRKANDIIPQITPHANPLQGQGQTSANFSASLEWTRRDIKSSYISINKMILEMSGDLSSLVQIKYTTLVIKAYHRLKTNCS